MCTQCIVKCAIEQFWLYIYRFDKSKIHCLVCLLDHRATIIGPCISWTTLAIYPYLWEDVTWIYVYWIELIYSLFNIGRPELDLSAGLSYQVDFLHLNPLVFYRTFTWGKCMYRVSQKKVWCSRLSIFREWYNLCLLECKVSTPCVKRN